MDSEEVPAGLLSLSLVPAGIALNLALATIISTLKLPFYSDAVGTIVVTILVGWRAGIMVGVMSFTLMAILFSPIYMSFVLTQVAIAIYVHAAAFYFRAFVGLGRVIVAGIGLGVVADIMSAPVFTWGLAQSTTGNLARDPLIVFLTGHGGNHFEAVFLSGLLVEPLDKTLQLIVAYLLLQSCPQRVIGMYPRHASLNRLDNRPRL